MSDVKGLCDQYNHFGEYMKSVSAEAGISWCDLMKCGVSKTSITKVYNGMMGVGPEMSRAFGTLAGVDENYYMQLFKDFKAEKQRRAEA